MGKLVSARRGPLAAVTAAALLLGLAGNAAGSGAQQRVVGGSVADPADWPFAAALLVRAHGKDVLDCGSSVIAPRFVVTAAHCAIGVDPGRFTVVVGRSNLRRTGQGAEIKVVDSKIDPAYGPPNFRNDLAILKLARPTRVTPIDLPTRAQDAAATAIGADLHVAGWGGTYPNGSHVSKRLRTTTETVIKPAKCRSAYGRSFSDETTICTRGKRFVPPAKGHAGSCYGDSGGPLVADAPGGPLLVGAVSGGGLRCGTSPDYYARIADALDFIRRATGVRPAAA
jgi:secreted trypsin-like serine protease